jgi:hypothetical protein
MPCIAITEMAGSQKNPEKQPPAALKIFCWWKMNLLKNNTIEKRMLFIPNQGISCKGASCG